ncbi:hypothetical protein BH10BDE1_BH10BDE1_15090 [soil metagenome]
MTNIFLKLLFAGSIFAVASSAQARRPQLPNDLETVAFQSLDVVASEQVVKTNSIYEAGEWPTKIDSTLVPVLVGVGSAIGYDDEASAFTTSSVANELGAIYEAHPNFRNQKAIAQIPELIRRGVQSFKRYREGSLFNFYPARMWKGVRVRQPIDMHLASIWKGFTNVPQDADTSSSVFATILYDAKLRGETFRIPDEAYASFDRYRDLNRQAHYYNRGEKRRNTGAYMTWQMNENAKEMPHYWFAEPNEGVRIPFNRNDVDCIVNLNVLRMRALADKTSDEGSKRSCDMINSMIQKSEHATCGIYYPNTYNMAFSSANLHAAGGSCIQTQRQREMVDFILKGQSADGGWDNDRNIWNDRIQSTAFAMTALLQFGDMRNQGTVSSLRYGVAFLLRSAKFTKAGQPYWDGEVFFTATAIARSLVVWRSTAFTTAVVANVLLKMRKHSPEWNVPSYLKIN